MTHRPDPPVRVLRSLPLAIVLGIAASAIGTSLLSWIELLIAGMPVPPGPVWLDYMAIRAVAGACLGAAMYALGWLPDGWLRTCLFWTLFFVLIEGDMHDFTRWSLGYWLEIWLVGSLAAGVIAGTLMYALGRRSRAAASRALSGGSPPPHHPGTADDKSTPFAPARSALASWRHPSRHRGVRHRRCVVEILHRAPTS